MMQQTTSLLSDTLTGAAVIDTVAPLCYDVI